MNQSTSTINFINDRIAASIIFGVGMSGIIVNFTGVLLTFRIRALRSSFGRLTAVHCSADCAILAIFTFWCAPRTFLEYFDHHSLISRKIGQVSLYFWFITLYSQLFISLNRFTLLFFPSVYKKIFQHRTRHLIIFYGVVCVGHFCVYFGDGCDFYFNAETYFWEFADTPCGDSIAFWLDFIFGCAICVVVLLLDVICVMNMRRSDSMMGDRLDSHERKLRSHREMRFLAQACCTGLLFTLMLCSFHVISRYVEGTWPTFVATTLVWELSHLGDGIILFSFNNEMKRALMRPRTLFSFSTINSTATVTTRVASTGSRQIREVSTIAIR
ncbi:hypothetical protein PRIPAC_81781 [Pristionchus pacificus]|uniref:G protein-coupled receptor n=1 Tax=Pristionchus pacificus TaxID=54126 RepID=A0A2A6C286_PRIPA|nr:hypothetical protein PRIPAC_81781 [Pristionchus pacificus]|eukprot:PDM72218.1 G protein-coupled receptor [Pristionchus pacificus]